MACCAYVTAAPDASQAVAITANQNSRVHVTRIIRAVSVGISEPNCAILGNPHMLPLSLCSALQENTVMCIGSIAVKSAYKPVLKRTSM